jgi:TatD DNase family protein
MLQSSRPVNRAEGTGHSHPSSRMIDTHCHLTDPRLEAQLPDVLSRAAAASVSRIITIGTDLNDDRRCIEICRGRENLRCVVGVHPSYVAPIQEPELAQLREIHSDPSVVALGEMGLDYHYGKDTRIKQAAFFRFQLQLALDANKPAVIHCREAVDDCLAILRDFPRVRAVFHCFTGTIEEGHRVLDAGYFLGFTGVVTFKNAGELREVVRVTPMDRLFVETDAPYLSPEPVRRQKVNEPALVMHTARVVAEIKGLSIEELDGATTRNVGAFFGWGEHGR